MLQLTNNPDSIILVLHRPPPGRILISALQLRRSERVDKQLPFPVPRLLGLHVRFEPEVDELGDAGHGL